MSIINIVAGPIIGTLIGYTTNYIAFRMLFRLLHPIRIGSFRIPFTPGIFPKRKEQLAKALGNVVGNNLLTGDDIENMFLTEELKGRLISEVRKVIRGEEQRTIKNMVSSYFTPDEYNLGKEQLEILICEKIVSEISKLGLGEIIARESARAIKEKTQGSMLALMANDKLVASLVTPIGEKV